MALRALEALKSSSRAASSSGIEFANEDIRTCDLRGATFVFLMNQDNEPGEGTKIWPLAVLILLFWV